MHSFRELEDAIAGGSFLLHSKRRKSRHRIAPPPPPPTQQSAQVKEDGIQKSKPKIKGHDGVERREWRRSSIQEVEEEEEIPRMLGRKSSIQEEEIRRRKSSTHLCEPQLPLMVVGAGLTAADAITIARFVIEV